MFRVDDIYEEAKKIFGACDDPKFFRWLGDAVTLVANKGDFEGWKGWVDICTSECGSYLTLPREVETVYGVNIGGHPTLGVGQLFNFHLNGPGDCTIGCRWQWQDLGLIHPTYRDIVTPSKVIAYTSSASDNGKEFIIYGRDINGNKLRRTTTTGIVDGYLVPTIYGYAVPDDEAPVVAGIDKIFKAETDGPVRLSTIDNDGANGTLLGVYDPDETLPNYRRIKLSRKSSWVRIAYRKTTPIFSSRYDHIPLRSRLGFLMAVRAVKLYSQENIGSAHAFEADAARLELEAQSSIESPTASPIQVMGENDLQDKSDVDIR